MAMSPLKYLMDELGIKSSEYVALSQKDRDDLKAWANEEIEARGL